MLSTALELLAGAGNQRQLARAINRIEDLLTPLEFAALGERLADPAQRAAYANRRTARDVTATAPQTYLRRPIGPHVALYSDPAAPRADKTLLICFAGQLQRLMIPNVAFLQGLPAHRYDIVILNDPDQQHFRRGCAGYATSFHGLVAALARDVPHDGYRRSVAFGASMGGLPAVWYGLMAGTGRTVCVGGRRPWDVRRILDGDGPPTSYDPLCDCSRGDHRSIVFLHAANHAVDRANAEFHAALLGAQRWSPSFGQFGGLIKLFPGVVHAASLLPAVAGASPGNGVGSIV